MGDLITVSDVRSHFTPSLSSDDVTDDELDSKINAVEDYIKAVYFNDSMPTQAKAKYPALLLVASKVAENSKIAQKYGLVVSETLGDYSYKISESNKNNDKKSVTWEQIAIQMLWSRASNRWSLRKSND